MSLHFQLNALHASLKKKYIFAEQVRTSKTVKNHLNSRTYFRQWWLFSRLKWLIQFYISRHVEHIKLTKQSQEMLCTIDSAWRLSTVIVSTVGQKLPAVLLNTEHPIITLLLLNAQLRRLWNLPHIRRRQGPPASPQLHGVLGVSVAQDLWGL